MTEILRVASDPAHDLIVMGAGRRGGLWRALTGSVCRAVARRARCPVVRVAVPGERPYPIAPWRVLLATDSREPDDYSLALARSLAVNAGEELFVLSVPPAAGSRVNGRESLTPRTATTSASRSPMPAHRPVDERRDSWTNL